jgi:phage terminase small subunit
MAPCPPAERAAFDEAFAALTPKQRQFLTAFIDGRNATSAYMKCNPRAARSTAGTEGFNTLHNPKIAAALAAYDRMMLDRVEVTKEQWLREQAIVAFSSIDDYDVDENGRLVLTRPDLPSCLMWAVSSVKKKVVRKGGDVVETTVEIRLWPKMDALGQIGRHTGLLRENPANANPTGLRFTLEQCYEAERIAIEAGILQPMPKPQPRPLNPVNGEVVSG